MDFAHLVKPKLKYPKTAGFALVILILALVGTVAILTTTLKFF